MKLNQESSPALVFKILVKGHLCLDQSTRKRVRKPEINFQLGLLIQPCFREHCPLAEEKPNKS